MDMKTDIINYLNQFDLDVRKTKDARFSDQKCTPDVICFIADCIRNSFSEGDLFDTNSIWESQYFIKNTRAIFNKPWPNDDRARHEYDKFIAQPLRLLASAHILELEREHGKNTYWTIYLNEKEIHLHSCHATLRKFFLIVEFGNISLNIKTIRLKNHI